MSTWFAVARAAFLKHLAYLGALMANSAGSCLLGLVYIALRHAATQGRTLGPFPAQEMESYIALSQAVLWVSVFLPSGLDIRHQIRTGSVALEMARPAPYVPRMVASGVGEALYNLMFRSGPLIICFTIRGVFPWADIATVPHALLLGAIWAALLTGVLLVGGIRASASVAIAPIAGAGPFGPVPSVNRPGRLVPVPPAEGVVHKCFGQGYSPHAPALAPLTRWGRHPMRSPLRDDGPPPLPQGGRRGRKPLGGPLAARLALHRPGNPPHGLVP